MSGLGKGGDPTRRGVTTSESGVIGPVGVSSGSSSSTSKLRGVGGTARGGGGTAPGGRSVPVAVASGMSTNVGIGARGSGGLEGA
jgi:hypothetical protein